MSLDWNSVSILCQTIIYRYHMQNPAVILAFLLSFNLAIAQQTDLVQLTGKFDKLLLAQFKPHEPGGVALVAWNGRIIYEKAFGMANLELNVPMRTEHVFKIASITKQFTAVAILQLLEEGKLDLQDEVTKFIPDYPMQGYKITIEHLLTHTSGILDFAKIRETPNRMAGALTPEQMIDIFKERPLRFPPGTQWEYSNSGYFLLGYIIERITGKTYGKFLEEQIFKPAGMSRSFFGGETQLVTNRADGYTGGQQGFINAPHISMTHPYAAGAILSTVEDLFKWNQALHSYKLIRKETLEKALTRYTLADGKKTRYGYGWRFGSIQDSPSFWHAGGINGFTSMAMFLPEEDVFVVLLSNCDANSPEEVTAKLAALAIGKPYEYKPIPAERGTLVQYTGVYENENGRQRVITISNDTLYSQLGMSPRSSIRAYEKDKFFFEDNALLSLEFTRNGNGEIERLILKSRDGNEEWNKTSKLIPGPDGVKLDETILERYVGRYEMTPDFAFSVTRKRDRLFVQATGQDQLEMFAESETKFFLKVNDAQFEFVADDSGRVTKVIVNQGRRQAEARRRQ
ncbi:serine hydrolase [Sphingobacteriales bacterium CHB3]|nr:serine hydrolase [Sphingobacteriales bacterium CHB3]